MQAVIQNLIQMLTKAGRTTIDFTNEDDISFFTPIMNETMTKMTNKNKKIKEVKEDKVKKDLNSYMIYCEWARKNTEFPTNQPKDISRRLGEMWRALSDEEKAGYKKQADANKRPVEVRADSPKRAESPKKMTPYLKFSTANRKSVGETISNPRDVSRRLGEMWRALSDEEKAKWKGDDKSGDVSVEKVSEVVKPVLEDKKEDNNEIVEDKRDESPKKTNKVKTDAKEGQDDESSKTKTKKSKKENEDVADETSVDNVSKKTKKEKKAKKASE